MAIILEELNRNVIPRWRDFASTVELGELLEPATRRVIQPLDMNLDSLEGDWLTHRTLSFAADLISAAALRGASEVVREAAAYVLELQGESEPGHPLTRLAKEILGKSGQHEARTLEIYSPEQMRKLIADHKRSLVSFPRDAILWVDLSLLYAMRGVSEKARRAMIVAIALEPDNRFVLRSAARLFIHLNEPDKAHSLLKSSLLIRRDPWIISAEIATATAADFVPFSIDQGLRTLAGTAFHPSETTELSAAIATLELRDGNIRKAKKHLRNGLRNPNENSLAQAKWISKELKDFLPDKRVTDFKVERSFEAAAWEALISKDWTAAASQSLCWLRDQPFSSRPAQIACHVTSALLEDFGAAEKIAEFGLVANPLEHMLHIALAFVYGSTNRTELAFAQLGQIRGTMTNTVEVAVIANHGLIKFREGDETTGRALYQAAVQKAQDISDDNLEASALTYWAREETRAGSAHAAEILARASEAVRKLHGRVVQAPFLLERVEREFEIMQRGRRDKDIQVL